MTGCTKAVEPCGFFSQEPSDAASPIAKVSKEDIPLRLRAVTPPSSTKRSTYSYYLIDESTGVGYLVEHIPSLCRITPILPSAASAAIAD